MAKILVIEDEDPLREDILETLECLYFEGIGGENGVVGVQLAQIHLPDLIICDIMMPELDGYGVLNALRQNPETATIPFIFLSAKADKLAVRQGMNLGAEDYLTKPFTISELSQAISTQLEKRLIVEKQSQEKLDELRSNITRSLPHELRTPLQGILGLSDILINQFDVMDSDAVMGMLKEINNSAHRLYRLIKNFLLYAELEIIAFDAERLEELQSYQTSSTKNLITNVASQKARELGREADLQLRLQDAIVNIAETHLKKIIEELIDNAFKFSSINTTVSIESSYYKDTYTVSLLNHGQGMTPEQIAKIGAYMQFERKLYEQQGSGLGLIIAKRLVELHGGKLTIESIPDEPIKVEFTLPSLEN